MRTRISSIRNLTDWAMRMIPVVGIVLVSAYIAAQQAISPQRRIMKAGVALALVAMMLRFDMIYSVFLFTILFPFPSGLAAGSTNAVLMTLIFLIWSVRAASSGGRYLRRTPIDRPIILLLSAFIISFFNVTDTRGLTKGIEHVWVFLACVAYFYMIVNFVNDEQKMLRMFKVLCGMAGFVMFTAVVEMFFPGRTIIPGWVGLRKLPGQGTLTYRIEGLRVGGALHSHAMLADMANHLVFIMFYLIHRARNPVEKAIWVIVVIMTFLAQLASANRGGLVGLVIGITAVLIYFRRRFGAIRVVLILIGVAVSFATAEFVIEKYSYAASITERVLGSEFEGVVPNNRVGAWGPALRRSMEHILIGHGPYYEIGVGLDFKPWPHNGYLFYLYTIGLFGLGMFFWLLWTLFKESLIFRIREVRNTELGNMMILLHIWLIIVIIGPIRTDFQRDDVHPFLFWACFGLVTAMSGIIRSKLENKDTPKALT